MLPILEGKNISFATAQCEWAFTASLISFFRVLLAVFALWVVNARSVVTVMSLILMICDAVAIAT